MKIPTHEQLHPRYAELEAKRNALHIEKAAKIAEAAIIRARIQVAPSDGNAAAQRVAAILGEAPISNSPPDLPRLEALLTELRDLNSAISILNGTIYHERNVASRKVCDVVRPESDRLGKLFARAYLALHDAHREYDEFIDSVERSGVNTSSLNRVTPHWLGASRDPCGGYHYALNELVEAGYASKTDLNVAVR